MKPHSHSHSGRAGRLFQITPVIFTQGRKGRQRTIHTFTFSYRVVHTDRCNHETVQDNCNLNHLPHRGLWSKGWGSKNKNSKPMVCVPDVNLRLRNTAPAGPKQTKTTKGSGMECPNAPLGGGSEPPSGRGSEPPSCRGSEPPSRKENGHGGK